jgi:uroporphyrin-III C-methyltransferase
MTGFVSFGGSGPGDPELLTVKAVNRLKAAKNLDACVLHSQSGQTLVSGAGHSVQNDAGKG